MSRPNTPTYKTRNWPAYNEALKRRGSLTIWFDPAMTWEADAPMLPELLSQIAPDQEIASVTADGAYDTRKCHDAIAERGAAAVIPPRKNAKPWKTATAGAFGMVLGPMADHASPRNEALRASKYLGRALWRRW